MKYRIVEMMNGKFHVQSYNEEVGIWKWKKEGNWNTVVNYNADPLQSIFETYEDAKTFLDTLEKKPKEKIARRTVAKIHDEREF